MGISHGTVEDHEYRGRTVRIWRTFEDPYGLKRLRQHMNRRWHFAIDGRPSNSDFTTRSAAIASALNAIDWELDGCLYWRGPRSDLYGDEYLADSGEATSSAAADRKSKLREWLLNVTEERGFTPSEAAAARQKLADFDAN